MMRLGLVGVGAWGRRYVDTIARRQDCQISAFARSSARVDGALPGAVQCDSWMQLLAMGANGALDGVIIATTPESQIEITEAAVIAGLPVLVEKPLGTSVQAVAKLQSVLWDLENPPPIVVDYVHLFAPAFLALKARLHASPGKSDPIASIESVGCNNGPHRGWSSLYDYGVHDVAMVLDLLGSNTPLELFEAQRIPADSGGPGEVFEVSLHGGDAQVALCFGNGSPVKIRRLSVGVASGRVLVYDDLQPLAGKLTDAGQPVPLDATPPLDGALSHFVACCQQWRLGKALPAHPSHALNFTRQIAIILDAVRAGTGV